MSTVVALLLAVWLTPPPPPPPDPFPVWDRLAACESGEWDRHGHPIDGTENWRYDGPLFEGGLNFHPATWDAYRPDGYPESATDATREQEIVVALDVLDDQGFKAWPTCSRKIGVRP